jgi:hypothetical protein
VLVKGLCRPVGQGQLRVEAAIVVEKQHGSLVGFHLYGKLVAVKDVCLVPEFFIYEEIVKTESRVTFITMRHVCRHEIHISGPYLHIALRQVKHRTPFDCIIEPHKGRRKVTLTPMVLSFGIAYVEHHQVH